MNWQERAEKAEAELEKLREQKPALYMAFSECGQFIRYWTRDTANLDATMAVNDFTVLEFFARPTPAPAVPEEWREVMSKLVGIVESSAKFHGCGDVTKQARALLRVRSQDDATFAALREENERLRDWIRVEGGCNNTCTRQILGEVCPSCRCGKAVKDAARGAKMGWNQS